MTYTNDHTSAGKTDRLALDKCAKAPRKATGKMVRDCVRRAPKPDRQAFQQDWQSASKIQRGARIKGV